MVATDLRDISEIRPSLFLSGFGCITEKKIRAYNITHIVDVTNIPNNPRYEGIEYLSIPVDDSLIANLTPHFANVAQFVQNAQKQGGKALIYCAAGISRSASLCIMCLVINEGLSLREAYYDIVSKRPFISPNVEFWRQMIAYECKQRGTGTVQLLKGMTRPIPDVYIRKPGTTVGRIVTNENILKDFC